MGKDKNQLAFWEESEKEEKEEVEDPYYLGKYDKYEVISAFVKSIRLGLVPDALYWLEVMIKGGADLYYIARRLSIESQESGYGPTPAIYAASVLQIVSVGRSHAQDALFQLTVYLCKCKKWWEDETMREAAKEWYRAEAQVGKVKKGERIGKKIPNYAIDVHTAEGRRRKQEGEPIDERFSGSSRGIFSIIKMYEKYGRLGAELVLEARDMQEIYKDVYGDRSER